MTMFRIKFSTWQQTPYFLIMILQNSIEGLIVILRCLLVWFLLLNDNYYQDRWRAEFPGARWRWQRGVFGVGTSGWDERLSGWPVSATWRRWRPAGRRCNSQTNVPAAPILRRWIREAAAAPSPRHQHHQRCWWWLYKSTINKKQHKYLMKIPRHIFRDVCMPVCVCMWYCLDFIFFGFVSTLCVCHLA